jgi:hypothetical protein
LTIPPSWSIATSGSATPPARAARRSRSTSARTCRRDRMFGPNRTTPPTSPRRTLPRNRDDGAVPFIRTINRSPTS